MSARHSRLIILSVLALRAIVQQYMQRVQTLNLL